MGKAIKLTSADMQVIFGVTLMTVNNWRAGKNGRTKLPFHTEARGSRHSVYFNLGEVRKWAKKNNVEMATEFPEELLRLINPT